MQSAFVLPPTSLSILGHRSNGNCFLLFVVGTFISFGPIASSARRKAGAHEGDGLGIDFGMTSDGTLLYHSNITLHESASSVNLSNAANYSASVGSRGVATAATRLADAGRHAPSNIAGSISHPDAKAKPDKKKAIFAIVVGLASSFLTVLIFWLCNRRNPRMSKPTPSGEAILAPVLEMPRQRWEDIDDLLAPMHGITWSLSAPLRSHQLVRLEARIERDGASSELYLTSPITKRACVCYTVGVSTLEDGSCSNRILARQSKSIDFAICPVGDTSVPIMISGTSVTMFYMSAGLRAWSGPFIEAPADWQAFAMAEALTSRDTSKSCTRQSEIDTFTGRNKAGETVDVEFKECALLVDCVATFVGELHRDKRGVMRLLPYEDPFQTTSSTPSSSSKDLVRSCEGSQSALKGGIDSSPHSRTKLTQSVFASDSEELLEQWGK